MPSNAAEKIVFSHPDSKIPLESAEKMRSARTAELKNNFTTTFGIHVTEWYILKNSIPAKDAELIEIAKRDDPHGVNGKIMLALENEKRWYQTRLHKLGEKLTKESPTYFEICQEEINTLHNKIKQVENSTDSVHKKRARIEDLNKTLDLALTSLSSAKETLELINQYQNFQRADISDNDVRGVMDNLDNNIIPSEVDVDVSEFDAGSPADLAATDEEVENAFKRATG